LGLVRQQVEEDGLQRVLAWLVRMDGAGSDSIVDRFPDISSFLSVSGGRVLLPIPMLPGSLYGIHPQGTAFAIAHQYEPSDGDSGVFRIRKLSGDGRLIFARNYTYSPWPLPKDYAEDFVEARRDDLLRVGVSPREAQRLIEQRLPRFELPIWEVRMAVDGSIWLKRESHEADPVRWWVLDKSGNLVGQLLLPADLRIRHIDRETVWGIEYDELGVNYIVRFRVKKD
jgi:hypothetical protein